jgi:diguanylate cyclase (GGDEF)-like protein
MSCEMISIKQSVSDLERAHRIAEKSIECYRDALRGVREHVLEASPLIGFDYRRQIEQLESELDARKILKDPAAVVLLAQIGEKLMDTVREFSNRSVEAFRQDTSNLRDILATLGGMAEALNVQNLVSSDEFQSFEQHLEELTRIEDLSLLRQSLSARVVDFRSKIDELSEKSRATISRLQCDVSIFRKKLDEAELQAATDPLTETCNRRELQRQIDLRIDLGKQFSLLMFDLNEFKSVNDRFGHAAGDHVLKHFANVVKSCVQPCDVVARWGGDEFIVVLDASIEEAKARSRQIFSKLEAPVVFQVRGRAVMLGIRASSGVAERGANETSPELFIRVDSFLYANKSARGLPSAV